MRSLGNHHRSLSSLHLDKLSMIHAKILDQNYTSKSPTHNLNTEDVSFQNSSRYETNEMRLPQVAETFITEGSAASYGWNPS